MTEDDARLSTPCVPASSRQPIADPPSRDAPQDVAARQVIGSSIISTTPEFRQQQVDGDPPLGQKKKPFLDV
ncbi:hypothetical protein MPNT_60115 [Candidatus Methylacidithermus pantelleriae]|uniref:Uncharacterized protein n=2 Tax=Candidatus Methylacidithermus pantelleriae TaxID=2744239 RepID=A0A8J2BQK4_9BACT|nr:hypothetical protein MPNT_60115 [Candidatus Methylacidithermus pantelleriae]